MSKIGIIGLGNMGEAILKAFLAADTARDSLFCVEAKAERARFIEKTYGIKCLKKAEEVVKKADYIILAIKPQDSKSVIQSLSPLLTEKKVVVSIMAGITTSNILSLTNRAVKVVRLMPNVCVKTGEGAIGMTANNIVEAREIEAVKHMFSPLGKVVEVREDLMDAITALVGSGPAFVCHFLEGMIDAGVKLGLPRDKATLLAAQVFKGTVLLMEREAVHPTLLKEMVTSPGGTTIAGLAVLEEGAVKGTVIKAVERACERSKELSL